jgi:hypothetical protein
MTNMMSNMYYYVGGDEKAGKREGKVGAGYTETPCGRFGISTGPTQSAALLGFGPAHLAQGFAPRPHRSTEMARPKQTEHRRGLLIKLLSQEKEIIRQQAYLAGLTVSEFIRKCALNRPIRSRVSREVAAELSKLFGLQKHLLREIKGLPNEEELRRELNSVLLELHMALATFNKKTAE